MNHQIFSNNPKEGSKREKKNKEQRGQIETKQEDGKRKLYLLDH